MSNPAAEAGSPAAGGLKKGPWTAGEDAILVEYVKKYGEGNWNAVQRNTGLSRCGKSCRLRWANHLRPNLKKGSFSPDEERLILELHSKMGNKWARMAAQLPGRTDNEIKNYWNTRIKRRQRAGLPLYPPELFRHRPMMQFGEQKSPFSGGFSEPSTSVFFQPPPLSCAPPPPPIFHFNSLGNYDLDPLQQCFSTKMELPSNQLFPEMAAINADDLFDSLRYYHIEEKISDGKVKIERGQEIAMDDDLSSLLGAIPASVMTSGGASTGQNSDISDVGRSFMHLHPLM